MAAFYRLLGGHSRGGLVLERDGLLAAVVPSCPKQSIVNAGVYERAGAVRQGRDELEAAYDRAGVSVWRVWVPERDHAVGEWLGASGHRLSGSPRAMMLDLSAVNLEFPDDVQWERTDDTATVAALNEQAYGLPDGEFAESLEAFADGRAHLYLAREQQEPAACVAALDAGSDCSRCHSRALAAGGSRRR